MVGPLIGAGLIAWQGIGAVFLLGAAMSARLGAAGPGDARPRRRTRGAEQAAAGHVSVLSVLLGHRRTLLTLGTAVVVIGASRSIRNALLPLWADHIGMSAREHLAALRASPARSTSLFFLPGGWLMDHRGRAVVAVPVVLAVAVGALVTAADHHRRRR